MLRPPQAGEYSHNFTGDIFIINGFSATQHRTDSVSRFHFHPLARE
jgi:hypothetical protein